MERKHYIDIMKGIGILLVIIGHMQKIVNPVVLTIIYSFHIPLFYFVSGLLYNEKNDRMNFKQYTKKIACSLLYPYLTLFILNMVYGVLKEGLSKNSKVFIIFWIFKFYF